MPDATGFLLAGVSIVCFGSNFVVTKKYKSSSYGNVTAEVTSTRVKPLCTFLTRAPRSMTC